jgi:hypothetical protein
MEICFRFIRCWIATFVVKLSVISELIHTYDLISALRAVVAGRFVLIPTLWRSLGFFVGCSDIDSYVAAFGATHPTLCDV